jgi:hypothetical protein
MAIQPLNVLRSAELNCPASPHEEAFGLWRDRSQDVLEIQESLRQDWRQP